MTNSLVEVEHLVFDYPDKRAICDTSFIIEEGSVTALVGPNGAGKTTLMKLMAALEKPYSGTVKIAGYDTQSEPRLCHSLLGFLPDFFGLYDQLTVIQHLEYFAGIHAVPKNLWADRVSEIAGKLKIESILNRKAGELSRGQKQRLAIGMSIIHKPKLLMLDEPASGLDPEGRKDLSDLIVALNQEGITLLVSSHILTELSSYSTAMLTCSAGKIIANKNLIRDELTNKTKIGLKILGEIEPAIQFCKRKSVEIIKVSGDILIVSYTDSPHETHTLLKELLSENIKVYQCFPIKEDLQETYFKHLNQRGSNES